MNFLDYQTLTINGKQLAGKDILSFCEKSKQENIRLLGAFMKSWLDKAPVIQVQTSGSTGHPKKIWVRKNRMLQSAKRTAYFFDFKEGQTALLCLPMNYIAGKMMVVRALYSALNLVCIEPDNQSIANISKDIEIDFAPLVPTQLEDIKSVENVRRILLGGAALSPILEDKLQSFNVSIYHGYGMTETLSHIAVRKVNGKDKSPAYKVLKGIKIGVDERSCLKIISPFLDSEIQTNDIVSLVGEDAFIWKGRNDFIINSGGIKFSPEEIEKKIVSVIPNPFFIAGLPDEKLGEKMILFIECLPYKDTDLEQLKKKIAFLVDKYERPKDIIFIPAFERTDSGKIQREKTVRNFY